MDILGYLVGDTHVHIIIIRIAQNRDIDDWKVEEEFLAIVVESGISKGNALDTQILVANDLR